MSVGHVAKVSIWSTDILQTCGQKLRQVVKEENSELFGDLRTNSLQDLEKCQRPPGRYCSYVGRLTVNGPRGGETHCEVEHSGSEGKRSAGALKRSIGAGRRAGELEKFSARRINSKWVHSNKAKTTI